MQSAGPAGVPGRGGASGSNLLPITTQSAVQVGQLPFTGLDQLLLSVLGFVALTSGLLLHGVGRLLARDRKL